MFRPQDHWDKYNTEKQWIDGKGWCDMNGVKINSQYQPRSNRNNRLYSEKQSVIKALLRSLKYLISLFVLYCIVVLLDGAKSNVSIIATLLWLLGNVVIIFHFFYFIYRCYKEDNLRL